MENAWYFLLEHKYCFLLGMISFLVRGSDPSFLVPTHSIGSPILYKCISSMDLYSIQEAAWLGDSTLAWDLGDLGCILAESFKFLFLGFPLVIMVMILNYLVKHLVIYSRKMQWKGWISQIIRSVCSMSMLSLSNLLSIVHV